MVKVSSATGPELFLLVSSSIILITHTPSILDTVISAAESPDNWMFIPVTPRPDPPPPSRVGHGVLAFVDITVHS